MTDIPLRPLGRNYKARDGYTQLQSDDIEESNDINSKGNGRAKEQQQHSMPASYKGKRPARSAFKIRHNGEDEEEALLAGGGEGNESDEEERRRTVSRASSSSRSVCLASRHPSRFEISYEICYLEELGYQVDEEYVIAR